MAEPIEEKIDRIEKTIDKLAVSVANGFEGAKKDLELFKLDTGIHFNNLETDLKSFKSETRERLDSIDEKLDDLSGIVMNHDKRIEVLEEKVLSV
jgi:chromosome segregation ATPase